ncbi:PGF-pre-PGF domain-containing protein [uncultured Methanolobus sp.]|uniref:PGF-pre-PGF domain-containing protein n=1 Tax=uncultured Methanolobus sp. TaxID=218300 RepID=UPI002AAC2346|nr:PGF-pre-PGF domain-containing protein [uncultured Methanolobus sp.]
MILLCTGIASAATYSGGSGTIDKPYQLSSDSDIDNLSATSDDWGYNFTLTNDITLVGNHTPIANQSIPFTGDFDGDGYTIKNLTVYTDNKAGFFAYIGNDAYIHDIGIEASSKGIVTSTIAPSGILAGSNKGTINNIYVIGNVTGADAGGLIGENSGGTITNSYANSTVDGLFAGGLIGVNDNANITNCYATGNVSGGFSAGGLIGNNNNANITNCYATGNVASTFSASGLIGENSDANVINCYHSNGLEDTYSTSTSYENFTNFSFVSGPSGLNWNASGNIITTEYNPNFVWRINDGSSLPYFQEHPYSGGSGTADDPYQLSNDADIDELSATSADWGMNFTLTQDIILVGNHTPIGNSETQFTGDFEGSGFAIQNMTVYQTGDYAGFFGYAGSGANIHDLGIEISSDGVFSTTNYVGGLVGRNNGAVSNSYATGNVTGSLNVGGLVGFNVGTVSTVSNSYATGNVTGSSNVGGLVGYNNGGTVSNSFATGTVSGSSESVGGLVGLTNVDTVINSYYSGNPNNGIGTYSSFTNFTSFAFISGSSGLNWNESGNNITTADDSNYIWKIIDGYTLPYFQYQDTPSPLAPYVETISPSSGANNTDSSTLFWINITGCCFNVTDPIFVNLTMSGRDPVTGTIDSRTYTTINATFNLTKAIEGDWSLYVINPNGQNSTAKTFTVDSLFTPSVPESFTNITGNFWVNHSWSADTSGTTDSYNISIGESWENGTTNNFYNHTGLSSHAWSNITVYAYNATDFTLSEGFSDKVQIPNNEIRILNVTDITTSEGETISFDINCTVDTDGDTPVFDCNRSSLFDDFNTSTGEGLWNIDFNDAGTYHIEFNVSDGYGSIDSKVMNVTVSNVPTMRVGSGSDNDYSSIQEAINDADDGDTIIVTDGIYNENVVVNKSVTLRSENGSTTTNINASDSSDHVFNVTVDNVTIDGFNVTGVTSSEVAGIYLGYSNNSIVTNNVVNNNSRGIVLDHSENNTLSSNIANNNSYYGIYLSSSSHNALDDNDIYNNYYGIRLSSSSDHNTLTDNTAMNNTRYGMYFGSSDNNTLTSNDANYNGRYGIYLSSSNNNTLTDNVASYNTYTYIEPASMSINPIVNPEEISGGPATGIFIGYSAYNILNGNTANYNEGSNGVLMASNSNAVSPNSELGSAYSCGFSLYNSENITLTGNTAIGNDDYEFYSRSSTNCTIDNLEIDTGSMELSFVPIYDGTAIRSNETISTGPSGKANVNGYLDIGLLEDMNMTIFYDDSGMSSSIESSVTLYKLNGNEWVAVPNATLNTSGNFVSVNLDSGVSVDIASIADYTSTYGLFKSVPSSNSGSDDDGVRASVSQGQNPAIVSNSASSVKRVTGGSEVNYDFSDSGTPVLGVSFDAKDDKGLVVSKVQVLSSTPEGVPASSGHSYQIMSIDVGSEGTISSASADNIMIHFKVSKQWIEENDIDLSTIRMTRYHGDQWNDLPTSQESEDGEYYYFYAETPGFSVFNVVGDEIGETSEQDTASASIVEEESEPVEEEETSGIPGFTAIAGVVFVLLSVILRRRQKFE